MSRERQPAGEALYKALRTLEIEFLNGGNSVVGSIHVLLGKYDVPYRQEMAKYLKSQSIIKRDENKGSYKTPYYWYNGPQLSVRYCNELFTQMKLEMSLNQTKSTPPADMLKVGDEFPEPHMGGNGFMTDVKEIDVIYEEVKPPTFQPDFKKELEKKELMLIDLIEENKQLRNLLKLYL